MQNVIAPDSLKSSQVSLSVLAHSIGGAGAGGDYAFKTGAGPYWQGKISVVSMNVDDACDVRGFIHSLRGGNGCFLMRVPSYHIETPVEEFYLEWGGEGILWGGVNIQWAFTNVVIPDPDDVPAAIPGGFTFQTTLSSSVDANNVCLTLSDALFADLVAGIGPGVRLWIGNDLDSGQLVDVVAVEDGHIEFRPHLRSAYAAGTLVSVGAVYGRFRLMGDVPAVPMNGQHSLPFDITFCEYY
jgi:hypothetical protein